MGSPHKIQLLFFLLVISLILSLVVSLAGVLFSKKANLSSEKLSPFECGFSSKMNHRSLFSVQFFLVCLIFVIFDVELIILFPLLSALPHVASFSETILFVLILLLLSVGLVWEWSSGMLEWVM